MQNELIAKFVKRAKNGDEAVTEQRCQLHCRRVYSLCLRMVANQSGAPDLTRDIILDAFRKTQVLRGEPAFSTWFYRLKFNVVLMHLRKKSHAQLSLGEMMRHRGETFGLADTTDHASIMMNRVLLQGALAQFHHVSKESSLGAI